MVSKLAIISGIVLFSSIALYLNIQEEQKGKNIRRRVIVIGAGLAGFSASIEAYNQGSEVILIEKEPRVGGNSAKASSGINAVDSETQKKSHSKDSLDLYINDTLRSGDGLSSLVLVNKLTKDSADAINFLTQKGVNLDVLSQCGGHSQPRTHRSIPREDGKPENVGFTIIKTLHEYTKKNTNITILTGIEVIDLLTNKKKEVIGIKYKNLTSGDEKELFGEGIVLTTGGWGADRSTGSLLNEYREDLLEIPTTNGGFTKGEGIKLARKIGAKLVHMDKVQLHPTGFLNPSQPDSLSVFLAPEALRASGGIILNTNGIRFVNELGRRDHVTNAILSQKNRFPPPNGKDPLKMPFIALLILNQEAADIFDPIMLGFYQKKGLVQPFENGQELCDKIGIDPEVLKSTLEQYSDIANSKMEDPFGKKVFPVKSFKFEEKLYLIYITPVVHYCMGGISFNEKTQVLDLNDQPIPNLFAAGEVTGGLHGQNRLAGNSLAECVVFGREAGKNAGLGIK
ncbi:3-oxosteroid 1-dehydrogenase [Anaeramoeba ignava]|uniref:fumarate reductase (NADH) n=1 Tax=Anaeramoeba ignava TaxID=1746090 RepID=A0A9Q0LHZ1_ANAIG|nr:3-oxosteroid 1-dehydrogenase [Anaeramoeba ignava]